MASTFATNLEIIVDTRTAPISTGGATAAAADTLARPFGKVSIMKSDGRLWFLFEDTRSAAGYSDLRAEGSDSIAFTTDTNFEDGMHLILFVNDLVFSGDSRLTSARMQIGAS
jgi:hypothetical protein